MSNGSNNGPPAFGPMASPFAQRGNGPTNGQTPFAPVTPPTNDPAWQPPTDPLSGDVKATARVIHREVPLVTIQTSWTVEGVRTALATLTSGQFDQAAQLVDAIVGDDRVQATMGSRTGGLFGRPIKHTASRLPGVDEAKADECLDAWRRVWPRALPEAVLSELQTWAVMLGFGLGQILWDTTDDVWVPHIRLFHPRFVYYHWTYRTFVATTLDGQVPVTPGDAHWLLHAPHGEYRGWMRGAVRSVAQPWLIRALTYRDWARYCERHGFPIYKSKSPAAGDPVAAERWRQALSTLGQESVVDVPQGVEPGFSYDLELLEASDGAWQGFDGLIQRCERSIILALLFQNLTTEVKEGSFAAARVHGDVRQSALEADARALSATIYSQIARPFAALNFGDPDLAPTSEWDISPIEDAQGSADVLQKIATAAQAFATAGARITDLSRLARDLGLNVDFEDVAPAVTPGAAPPPEDK